MDYPTASTLWSDPEPSDDVKSLINLFFTLVDSKAENAGDHLAEKVFTSNGEFMLAQGTFRGTLDIRNSRKDAWITLTSRCHTVLKAYANTADGMDLVFIGNLAATTHGGDETETEFVARVLIDQSGARPLIRQYRVIVPASQDASPIIKAP